MKTKDGKKVSKLVKRIWKRATSKGAAMWSTALSASEKDQLNQLVQDYDQGMGLVKTIEAHGKHVMVVIDAIKEVKS